MSTPSPIYLGSILLEPNRWVAGKRPSYRVSQWSGRIAAAGFDGIELWENHAALADDSEVAALGGGASPCMVFSSYAPLSPAGAEARGRAVSLVRRLGCRAVKFNFGASPAALDDELRAAQAWSAAMPGVRMLCECHPGTALQTPEAAAAVTQRWPEMEVILHPFGSAESLLAWLRTLRARVTHLHVQATLGGPRRCRLRQAGDSSKKALHALRAEGFAGSFTIEFTDGVGQAPEDREVLFAAACDDLAFLREHWT